MSIPAAVFKAECLRLMDEVARSGRAVVITKHGRPVAQLVPVPAGPTSLFGYMKDTLTIEGDIVAPSSEPWSADLGDGEHLTGAPTGKRRAGRAARRA